MSINDFFMNKDQLTGIILSGGKSSRMGEEKGLVDFRGKPLISYAIDALMTIGELNYYRGK